MSALRRAAIALAAALPLGALAAACGPAVPPLPPPLDLARGRELGGPARAAALADLRAVEERPASFVAVHALDALDVESGRGGRLTGVLAVARPDRFRLRSVGPAGLTVLDLTYRGGAYRAVTAGGREERRGRVGRGPAPRGVPVEAVARAFLSRLAGTRVTSIASTARARIVRLRAGPRELRVALAPSRAVVLEERSLLRGREELRLRYADHRQVAAGVWMPYRIAWTQASPALRATIVVRRYQLDPALPAAAFTW